MDNSAKSQCEILFDQIKSHIKYHHNLNVLVTEHGLDIQVETDGKYRRHYQAKVDKSSQCVNLGIKEDGGTRTVFNGRVYTFEQYLIIDQLAR